jgi:riboflavin synthase
VPRLGLERRRISPREGRSQEVFTGLIQDVGLVRKIDRAGELVRLTIQSSLVEEGFELGESVAVDGVCLTVVSIGANWFQVEVSPESLERTTLGEMEAGMPVNLERALRLSDRLGGHLVTGHVDGVGVLRRLRKGQRHVELEVAVPSHLGRYLVEKGSIAVDGISLTINKCGQDWFGLTLIPHTIARTTLAVKGVGAKVNIECDILGKYVERLLGPRISKPSSEGITEEMLKRLGFVR